ncbi:unnamed protein product [Danaus chrysippus]|uniref:(African queen) hypothetical protein n=1 Tax=Danaus chrysippus TaxID=151541 RepID=A0A8J2RBN7_9NEOP|nr:unnamed protein product [Danaus chrysippus]
MRNKLLLCLVLVCALTNFSECKWGGRSGSSSRSSSRWGGGSSSTHYKPSSSWSSSHKYPSSSSGLSGYGSSSHSKPSTTWNSGSSWSSGLFEKHQPSNYPASHGLSGSSSGSKYPPSTGLSGSSFGSNKYPASTGLSGTGSGSYNYPSLSNFGSSGSFKLPTINYPSSTGLSGSGSGINKYPPSTGLSGTSSGFNKYPSSTGLSGTSSGSNKYPPSTGLSGTGSGTSNYPSLSNFGSSGSFKLPTINYPSSTGLSGSSSGNNKYPSSTGLSGTSSGFNKYPSSTGLSGTNSGFNKYPSSTGLSGTGSGSHKYPTSDKYYPTQNYPTSNINSRPIHPHHTTNVHETYNKKPHSYGYGNHGIYNPPTYYSAPQHVYITEYRNSGSRFSDLLSGLALYNLGRSHNHMHDHYYYDDYYRHRYHSNGNSHSSYDKPNEEARCLLRVKQNDKIEVLKIPCEIVSTFTEGSQKLAQDSVTQSICVTNVTVINSTSPITTNKPLNLSPSKDTAANTVSLLTTTSSPVNVSSSSNFSLPSKTIKLPNDTINSDSISTTPSYIVLNPTTQATSTITFNTTEIYNNSMSPTQLMEAKNPTKSFSEPVVVLSSFNSNSSNLNNTLLQSIKNNTDSLTPSMNTSQNIISQLTTINSTKCTVTEDPLAIKGPPLKVSDMECEVDIVTKNEHFRNKINCKTLMEYAKMPEPKKESSILPPRSKLKSWMSNPPWWLSMFIAV